MASKVTYRIDRLSNTALELGLKTGAVLTGSANNITSAKPLSYTSAPTLGNNDGNVLTHKTYVDTTVGDVRSAIVGLMKSLITADSTISITKNWTNNAEADPVYTLGLAPYTITLPDGAVTLSANQDLGSGNLTESSTESGKVVSGITIDKYGRVAALKYTQVSVANLDLSSNTSLDNFIQFNIKVGSAATASSNTFAVTSGNTAQTSAGKGSAIEAITGTSPVNLQLLPGNGITLGVAPATQAVTFGIDLADSSGLEFNASNKLQMAALSENATVSGLYKFGYDKYGRITSSAAITASDIRGISSINHATSTNGLVNAKTNDNTETASESTYFYTSIGKWATIPFEHIKVETATGASPILAAASGDSSVTAVKSAATINATGDISTTGNISGGNITATNLSGNGSAVTNLSASNIASGTVHKDRLPMSDIRSNVTGGNNLTQNQVLIGGANNTIATLAAPADTSNNVLTATSTTAPHWKPISELVTDIATSVVSQTGGFVFKGILGDGANQIASLPTTGFEKGWFYRAGKAGTYAGHTLEVGDAIYAIKDCPTGTADSTYWASLEQNLTDAVTFSATSISSGVLAIKTASDTVIHDGITATLADSVWTVTANVSGSAATLTTARTLWGQSFNGSANISGNITGTGDITPTTNNISAIGTENLKYKDLYVSDVHATNVSATTFTGALSGKASTAGTADKVANKLTFTGYGNADVEYDGSAATSIDLSATSLGYLKSFANITAKSGTENAINGLTVTTSDGVITVTPSYTTLVGNVTSDIFTVTGDATKSIAFKSSAAGGIFYTGTTNPTQTNRLNYGGNLYATNLYANGEVVLNAGNTKSGTADTIVLLNDTNGGIKKSSYSISSNSASDNDSIVLTSSAVHTLTQQTVSDTLKCKKIQMSATTVTGLTGNIPANSVIEHIDIRCTSAYTANPAFVLKIGGTEYVGTSTSGNYVDLTTAGDVFTYKFSSILASASAVTVEGMNNASGAGAGWIYIYYI